MLPAAKKAAARARCNMCASTLCCAAFIGRRRFALEAAALCCDPAHPEPCSTASPPWTWAWTSRPSCTAQSLRDKKAHPAIHQCNGVGDACRGTQCEKWYFRKHSYGRPTGEGESMSVCSRRGYHWLQGGKTDQALKGVPPTPSVKTTMRTTARRDPRVTAPSPTRHLDVQVARVLQLPWRRRRVRGAAQQQVLQLEVAVHHAPPVAVV